MNSWMLCKVKYTKQLDNGTFKRVTEQHLMAAQSFTDAEARVYEELGSIIRGEFQVTAIARQEFQDIFDYSTDGDNTPAWFKCTVSIEKIDEDSEKVSAKKEYFLVRSNTIKAAGKQIEDVLAPVVESHRVIGVVETPIIEVYPFRDTEPQVTQEG
jgi:hypothetical protein